jgi:hypothetical protein
MNIDFVFVVLYLWLFREQFFVEHRQIHAFSSLKTGLSEKNKGILGKISRISTTKMNGSKIKKIFSCLFFCAVQILF